MEVADTFSPSLGGERPDAYDQWRALPPVEANGHTQDGVDQARSLVARLSETTTELAQALSAVDAERDALRREHQTLHQRTRELEAAAAGRDAFRQALVHGAGAALGRDELDALRGVTEALTADPDRLTTLFAVVQQAQAIATVVRIYDELRTMATEG